MKQTAVEFIEEYLRFKGLIINDKNIPQVLIGVINQAKEMEKQQIIDFSEDYVFECVSCSYSGETINLKEAEQYYNETFKNK